MKIRASFVLTVIFLAPMVIKGQTKEGLICTVEKEKADSHLIYNLRLTNFTDSIVAIPHSIHFIFDETNSTPVLLAVYDKNDSTNFYQLIYTAGDTLVDPQVYPAAIGLILPRQSVVIPVTISANRSINILSVEYAIFYDLQYRSFLRTPISNWGYTVKTRRTMVLLKERE